MREADLFHELIQIADLEQREARLEQIAREYPQFAESLRKLLDRFEKHDDFFETNALDHLAELPDGKEFLQELKRYQEPKKYRKEDLAMDFLEKTDVPGMMGKFGSYEIESLISHGGSAMVFKGYDSDLDKTLAIKILHQEQLFDPGAITRLQKEARAMGRIQHENVVEVFRIGLEPIPFITMEYVQGESLAHRINQRGPIEIEEFMALAPQILRGVQAAHEQGLIHRDLKPGNILLTDTHPTIVKVTDFGLVRKENEMRLTTVGGIVGTLLYMSPEQIRDDNIDHRSDLFSLGSVFYEMLCGVPPFQATKPYLLMSSITKDPPKPCRSIRQDIPEGVEKVILRLLEKTPMKRYQSAAETLVAIEASSKPVESKWFATAWAYAFLSLATVVLLGFVWTRVLSSRSDREDIASIETAKSKDGTAGNKQLGNESSTDRRQVESHFEHPWVAKLRVPFSAETASEYQRRWADSLGVEVESENQFGIRFVLIPPGEFLMGYSEEELQRELEGAKYASERENLMASSKPTMVRISFPFYMSKYEITEEERFLVIGTDHSSPTVLDLEYDPVRPRSRSGEHPATRVPWDDALLFCQRLNEKCGLGKSDTMIEGGRLTRDLYRLPTEAEWEWACRAGREGVAITDWEELDREAWIEGNSAGVVRNRGLKLPNPFRLNDMLGNVQEWCLDNFHPSFFAGNTDADPVFIDPLAINEDVYFKDGHVLRGGAVIFGKSICSFPFKMHRERFSSSWFTGFRVVRPVPREVLDRLLLDPDSQVNTESN